MANKRALLAGVLLAPVLAMGQFDFGGGPGSGPPKKPWEELTLNPKTTMKLAFRNASIDSILSLFERTSKITIVKDPTLTGGLTVTSAQPVKLAQAFQILSTTLSLKGYEMVREEKLLVIRKKDQRGGNNNPWPAFDPTSVIPPQPEIRLRVFPITHANASQLARVINEVFAGQGGGGFPGGFPGGGGGFPGGGGRGFGGGGGGNQQNQQRQQFLQQMMGRMGQQQTGVRASSDDFSNSVIVNAPENMLGQVDKLIKDLDKQTEEPQKSKVFKLEFAGADELVPVIQNVLQANVPRGRGGATTQQAQGPQAFINALRGNTAGAGNVTSDPRTNSIVVTATDQNLALVEKVIDELDAEVKYEPSTFVFPLANARADSVATLIQSAFGQRQGTGNFGGNRGTNTGNTRNNQNRNQQRNNQGGANRGGLGGEIIDPETGLSVDLQDPNAESGDLLTNIGVTQGFGGQFFGGGQNQRRTGTQGQATQGRDANGRLVNVRDLTGQVTAIPDPNTNSIIVVTTPENADLIRNILDQLDKIPEQVMIETIIVEATLDSTSRLGVEWKFANEKLFNSNTTGTGTTDFGQQTNPPQQGFRYTLTGNNLNVFLNAFKNDTKFQVLSTPRIFTSNNVEAEINISQRVPYVLNSRQDVNGNFTFNYGFEDVGIVLTVTPRITSNGYVTMDVLQTANDLQGYTDFNAPIINQRSADTTISVRDGETIVLGGIIRNTVNAATRKVPILGDLPLLGNLFKSTTKSKVKTELLVFLTPRVVRDPDEARKLREESQNKLSPESLKSIESLIKSKDEVKPPAGQPGGEPKKNGGQ